LLFKGSLFTSLVIADAPPTELATFIALMLLEIRLLMPLIVVLGKSLPIAEGDNRDTQNERCHNALSRFTGYQYFHNFSFVRLLYAWLPQSGMASAAVRRDGSVETGNRGSAGLVQISQRKCRARKAIGPFMREPSSSIVRARRSRSRSHKVRQANRKRASTESLV
jgi:hypothetical protein